MLGLFDQLGAPEIIIILAVFLLLFGAKKLPELARSLGRSSTEFKKGIKEGGKDLPEESEATTTASAEAKPVEKAPADSTE
jgi:sec-independent protein translocase protein TatA